MNNRLLLVNHADSAMELSFPWRRGPRRPFVFARVPLNGVVDIAEVFPELSKDQARVVIENSPDYIRFRTKFLVELVDESSPPPDRRLPPVVETKTGFNVLPIDSPEMPPMPPNGDPEPAPYHPFTPPMPIERGVTRERAAEILAQEKAAAEAYQKAQKAHEAGDLAPMTMPPSSSEAAESGEPTATGGLEPGMKEQLADSIPSTRWSQERLTAYAAEKGIDVTGLSKNAVLRKIRGA
jgi:hypothetical protein